MLDSDKKTTAEITKERLLAAVDAAGIKPPELLRRIAELSGKPLNRQTVHGWLKTGRIDKLWLPFFEQATGQNLGFSVSTEEPALPINRFSDLPIKLSPKEEKLIEELRMLADVGRIDEVAAIYKTVHESAGVARKMKDHILKKYLPEKERGPRD